MRHLYLRGTQKIAIVALFSALAIGTDYAMFPLSNIKLMDTIVFVSALVFGLDVGILVGGLTWLVYGSVNPLGAASGLLLLILMVSETVYAFLGYLARRATRIDDGGLPARSLLWGSLGFFGTLLYDLNTIITPSMLAGASLKVALASLIPAIPFMLAHEVSNFIFFGTVGPVLVTAILKVATQKGIFRSHEEGARAPVSSEPAARQAS